ncbi:hemolysin family protein [Leptolyngbya sp. FACHB-261]|uniref:hemolysin family protein n=1 Tax=Leptolyngbya sp. FACHB-261 TaxID=2692806 RepID=UPI0016843FD6|nr:hemolysin family protein [Leptolyngbya sp. FACHB-261]MBD2103814.1 HlyC/CorC family transporter [Leptolyngbya sp. FACHB-261]
MSSVTFEILLVFLLILANGIFSMSEMAVISARKARLQQWASEGDGKAQAALDLANAPNNFLSTVQIGITLVGILAGAFGGATIAEPLAAIFSRVPLLAPYSQALGLGIVVAVITYLSLVVGELVPKRLALNNPERIASTVATPMGQLSKIAAPVVHLLGMSTDLVMRMLGIRASTEPPITEEEIQVLIEQGTQAGMFEQAEQDMVERVFRLGDQQVSALMTPRRQVVWLDLDDSLEENRHKMLNSIHSRFPVCQGSLDNVLGIIQVKDLFARSTFDEPLDLTTSLRQPLVVPESTQGLKVLESFKQTGMHTALAVDEYGGVQGLVTLYDILEAIVGDVPSVGEHTEPQAVQREDGSWLLDGLLTVDEFKDLFDLEELPGEERGSYQTLGGFVLMYLGHIPSSSEHFEWGGLRFEVVDMDGNRVDKVLVMAVKTTS